MLNRIFPSKQFFVSTVAICFLLVGLSNQAAAHPSESTLKKALDRGHLVVGVRSTTPGFGFKNAQGELVGFDVDLAREIAGGLFGDRNKIKFEILASGKDRIPALVSGRVDMVVTQFSVFIKRAQVAGFSIPYCNASFAAIVRADSPYKKNADLNNKVVTTRQGAELEKLIKGAIPDAKVEMYPNLSDAFMAFKQGRAEAMFNDHAAGLFITNKHPGKYRVIADTENPLDANQYSIGVRQHDQVWLNYIDWALIRLNLNGKLGELHMKWLTTTDLMPNWARLPY